MDLHGELAAIIGEVATRLLGEPNRKLSNRRTRRYGGKGALAVHVAGEWRGSWYDFATDARGGVLDLIVRERGGTRAEAWRWLLSERLLDAVDQAIGQRSSRGPRHRRPSRSSMPR